MEVKAKTILSHCVYTDARTVRIDRIPATGTNYIYMVEVQYKGTVVDQRFFTRERTAKDAFHKWKDCISRGTPYRS